MEKVWMFHRQEGYQPIVRLPANAVGRDFVMGDLHGELDQLRQRLAEVEFDPSKDRLFSVGDLIDRRPESLACLRLLSSFAGDTITQNQVAKSTMPLQGGAIKPRPPTESSLQPP